VIKIKKKKKIYKLRKKGKIFYETVEE